MNIRVTRKPRSRDGEYSVVSAMAFGMQPPSPRPVSTRNQNNAWIEAAQAVASVNAANVTMDARMTGRRPRRSASGAMHNAPSMIPTRPAEKTGPRALGAMAKVLIRLGPT